MSPIDLFLMRELRWTAAELDSVPEYVRLLAAEQIVIQQALRTDIPAPAARPPAPRTPFFVRCLFVALVAYLIAITAAALAPAPLGNPILLLAFWIIAALALTAGVCSRLGWYRPARGTRP